MNRNIFKANVPDSSLFQHSAENDDMLKFVMDENDFLASRRELKNEACFSPLEKQFGVKTSVVIYTAGRKQPRLMDIDALAFH